MKKYLLFVLLLFMGCEKDKVDPGCKECTYSEMGKRVTIFVCGEELEKFERDNIPCIKIPTKN